MLTLSASELLAKSMLEVNDQMKIDSPGTSGKRSVNNSTGKTTVSETSCVSWVNNPDNGATEKSVRLAYFKHDTGHVNFGFVDWDGPEVSRQPSPQSSSSDSTSFADLHSCHRPQASHEDVVKSVSESPSSDKEEATSVKTWHFEITRVGPLEVIPSDRKLGNLQRAVPKTVPMVRSSAHLDIYLKRHTFPKEAAALKSIYMPTGSSAKDFANRKTRKSSRFLDWLSRLWKCGSGRQN